MTAMSIIAWVCLLRYSYCTHRPELHIFIPDEVTALAHSNAMGTFSSKGEDNAVYLMPVHWKSRHWALFAFHAADRTIVIMDSFAHPPGSRNKLALDFAKSLDRVIQQETKKPTPGLLIVFNTHAYH